MLQLGVLTSRCFYDQGFPEPEVFEPGVLESKVLSTRGLTTGAVTTRTSYDRGSYKQGFLQPGIFTTMGLPSGGSYNQAYYDQES